MVISNHATFLGNPLQMKEKLCIQTFMEARQMVVDYKKRGEECIMRYQLHVHFITMHVLVKVGNFNNKLTS